MATQLDRGTDFGPLCALAIAYTSGQYWAAHWLFVSGDTV